MKIYKILFLLLILPLVSCTDTASREENNPQGIFYGSFFGVDGPNRYDYQITALVSNNRITMHLHGSPQHVAAKISYQDDSPVLSGKIYISPATTGIYTDSYSDVVFSNTVLTKDTISSDFSFTNSTGSFFANIKTTGENNFSLSDLSHNWSSSFATSSGQTYTVSISIDDNGMITGSDGTCVFSGTLTSEKDISKVFETNLNISSCGNYNGEYSGLTGKLDENTLILSTYNDSNYFNVVAFK